MRRWPLPLGLILLLVGTTLATAGPTVHVPSGEAQNSTIQYFSPRAGAGVVVDFDSFTTSVNGAPAPVANVIGFAAGTRWNGRRFPQCRLAALRARGPVGCPSGSLFALGYADAPPLRHLAVKAFIATVGSRDAQLFWISPGVVLVGLLSHNGGPITETIAVPSGLPAVEQFHVTDLRRSIHGLPLTVAPARCPAAGWSFSFTTRFATGPALVSVNHQPCVGRG